MLEPPPAVVVEFEPAVDALDAALTRLVEDPRGEALAWWRFVGEEIVHCLQHIRLRMPSVVDRLTANLHSHGWVERDGVWGRASLEHGNGSLAE